MERLPQVTKKPSKLRRPRVHVLYCGAPTENDDFAYLNSLSEKGGTNRWSSVRGARAGDRVLFYMVKERRAFVASGWITRDARATNDESDFPYRARVGGVRVLLRPVPISAVRKRFPKWGWARQRRNITTVPMRFTDELWRFIHQEANIEAPPPAREDSKRRSYNGGGFGSAENNKLVEEAAVRAVTRLLEGEDFDVESMESQKCGYDLLATRGKEEFHYEVKGVAGDVVAFQIARSTGVSRSSWSLSSLR